MQAQIESVEDRLSKLSEKYGRSPEDRSSILKASQALQEVKTPEISQSLKDAAEALRQDNTDAAANSLKNAANNLDYKMHSIDDLIKDAGHTQVDPGTVTCFGTGPWFEEEIDKVLGKLKLL